MDIAKASQAELVGLTVTDPLRLDWTGPKPMGVGVEAAAAELRKQRYERAAADVAAAKEAFAQRCLTAGVPQRSHSCGKARCRSIWRSSRRAAGSDSLVQRVEQHVESDLLGILAAVAGALERVLLLERTGEIVRREDHRSAVADPDPLEFRRDLSLAGRERTIAPRRLAERHLADVEAAVFPCREDRVVDRDLLDLRVG